MTNQATNSAKPEKVKGKKHHGCLISLLVAVVILGVAVIIVFHVPQKIGLVKSPAEKMYTQPNDPDKAALIVDNLAGSGLDMQGVEVYVMPVKGTDDNTAFIVLDASKGFNFNTSGSTDPVSDFIALAAQAQQQGINRAAVVYYDEQGKALMTLTVATADMTAYTQGKITDKQLMEKVDIHANNLIGLIGDFSSAFK
jgi:hypothetical protein